MERIYITKAELDEYERKMRIQKHLDRYFLIRQFCYGTVIDCACGVGYGSHIIQTNQDVKRVYGLDIDKASVDHARLEFGTDKTEFLCMDMNSFEEEADVLVSIETIEHIEDPTHLASLAERAHVKDIIVSFPTKKSTHFNPYHKYDLYTDDLKKIFQNYRHINTISIGQEVDIVFFTRRHDLDIAAPRKFYHHKES